MREEEITRAVDTMIDRIVCMLGDCEITICQAADRYMAVQQWAEDRRVMAGVLVNGE